MPPESKSIRAFIGSLNFEESRRFYRLLGFQEIEVDPKLSFFSLSDQLSFYLQDYYVKDWVENSMLFWEVEEVTAVRQALLDQQLIQQFPTVRISEIQKHPWGEVCYLHDPSGILWHIGHFHTN